MGPVAVEVTEVHEMQKLVGLSPSFGARDVPQPQRQLDVRTDGEPREQGRLLEQQGGAITADRH
jgi:hypothetical protein